MKQGQLIHIQIAPSADNPSFAQRESGVTHTSYQQETAFYSLVQQGDTERLREMMQAVGTSGIVIGRLSANSLRQMQYWAVCCTTLAIRYAIQGGLDEMRAFNFSDQCILQIDQFTEPEAITAYMARSVLELTELVRHSSRRDCPVPVCKCLDYIEKHLHETIRLADLAGLTGLSEDYLSKLFKKHVGTPMRSYVLEKNLEAAKAKLRGASDQKLVAYYLGFCSQTYFITRFKKAYGVTPHQYAVTYRKS
ncbi:MAG: AraC family transcriptional regulator [Clostridiales bacterium]|nr:AraC family transcriptional regulator [Clostridiales bacterium]